jgi:2-amino-4-hydroxy-6-hydroxymethyldihydropteridine diphosphokinase
LASAAHRAVIALGSNLDSAFGGPADNLCEAIGALSTLGQVTAVSRLLETEPVGYTNQPNFLNGAALLETGLAPLELLRALLEVERLMGRVRDGVPAKGPRILDLDLIFYDDLVVTTPELTLPHPAMHQRAFVLEPLAEIAPQWVHPIFHKTVEELLGQL